MAWPPLSSRSEPSSCSTSWRSDLRRHRRRKQFSSSSSILSPSSTLLSFLASLVSATTANASPAPPAFLCPSISDSTTPSWCHDKRAPPSGKVVDHQQEGGRSKLRRVPDRFVEGRDGIWRRVESYTLYGVTAPTPNCDNESCPPPQPIASTGVGFPINGTALSPPPVDIQLPPGWNTAPKTTNNRTTTILAVSLALSLFICFLIIICLFWRKGLLKKKKGTQDVEARDWRPNRRETHSCEEHRNIEVEKEAKALQKIWARASARWKANARYSLRQRKGKRFFTRSHHQSPALTVDDSRSHLASRPPSVQSSPIPSHNHEPLDERPPNQESQNPTSRPSSPPAYHTGHQIPPIIISSPQQTPGFAPSHLSRRLSQPSLYSTNAYRHLPDLPAAHVATDDKTLLARLSDLASAPPNETDSVANMSLTQVSAPEDLEFEDSMGFSTSTQMDSPPSVSLLPPPPSKERLAAAERLEYTFAYDNLENTEPEPEPSAPPFEESSAMPPLDQSMLFPSAPPIINDEEDRVLCPSATCLPSAPHWRTSFHLE